MKRIGIHSPKYGWNLDLAASAVEAIAVMQFSFTIEQPLFTNPNKDYKMVLRYGSTSVSLKPSIKLVSAAAA